MVRTAQAMRPAGTRSPGGASPEVRRSRAREVARAVWSGTVAAFGVLRRLRLDRVAAVAALLTAAVLVLVETPVAAGLHGVPIALALGLSVVHAGSLPLAIRRPQVAAPAALAAALLLQALATDRGAVWPWWPTLIVTQSLVLGAVAFRVRWPSVLLHWILALAASAVLAAVLRPGGGDATAINLTVFGGVSAGVIGAAQLGAQWRRIRTELVHERRIAADESARRLVMEERTRIARELHDVIAHSMSIITVQSSTARFRHPGFDAEAVAEFDRIGALSRQALDEMRGLLQVLRGSDEQAELRPQPVFADLPELVAQAGRAGTRVTYEQDGVDAAEVGELAGLAAYRIAQEAISNAIRHAPGSTVHVTAEARAGRLLVSVVNGPAAMPEQTAQMPVPFAPVPVRPSVAPAPSIVPGHGLVGMTERAATVGGTVRCGRTDDDGFAVRAVLPLGAAPLAAS